MSQALEQILQHDFSDKALLEAALTHSSVGRSVNYERLEFLGDRVLGLIISEKLYRHFSDESEGDMAKRLASLVQGITLAKIARKMDLGPFIQFSDSEKAAGGADNDNILADVFEAVLGALYLDAGKQGLSTCRAFIDRLWEDTFFDMVEPPQHPKTALQEWAQGKGLPLPSYDIAERSGPDHAPVFTIALTVEGHKITSAQAPSRQEGERRAAKAFLETLK